MQASRREFVKWVTASGIALSLSRLASAEEPGFAVRETLPGRGAWNPAATGVGRRLRSGASRAARRRCREIRRGNRPGQNAQLRPVPFYANCWPDPRRTRSPVKDGWVSPGFFEDTGRPIWARLPIPSGQAYAEAASYGEKIRAELAANNPALLVLDREFET